MSAGTALAKIRSRVKQLQKKHPNAKFRTLQKQAGREFKAGTIPKKRKPAKRKAAKRKSVRRKVTVKRKVRRVVRSVKTVGTRRRRTRRKPVKRVARRRRVGGTGGMNMLVPVLALGALGVGAYLLLKPKPASTQLQYTGNPARDNSASNILAWATAAGIGVNAIAALIQSLNRKTDAEVQQAAASVDQYGDLPPGFIA
jgi:hypothetical protein